jgi:mycothione reductase
LKDGVCEQRELLLDTVNRMTHYDVIVIGSGGGMKIALAAASMGRKTAFIEQGAVGGTCLNRGCIPSKMLIYPTHLPRLIREGSKINVTSDSIARIEFAALIKRITEAVNGMSARQRSVIEGTANLDFYAVHAEFVSDRTIRAGEDDLEAERIFIATGARPHVPDIPGLAGTPFMTSTEALARTDLPEHLLVIGGGYIAVELGGAYAGAGANVTFLVRSRFLRHEDQEVAEAFSADFICGHSVYTGVVPIRVDFDTGLFSVTCRGAADEQKVFTGDALLVATGVVPSTDDLGLQNTGVETDKNGFIHVDNRLRTSVEGVYALGDCVGNHLYRHTANYEAEYLVRTVFQDSAEGPIEYGPVPHAVFSVPEIAGVGMTEEQAAEQGRDYVVGRATYADSNAGLARGYDVGFAKLLVERPTRKILGAHILGDEASDMIHVFIAMMKKEGTLDDLLDMIFIHPSLPEIARDAARDAQRSLMATS